MLSTSIHHRQTLTRRVVHHRLLFQLNTGNHHGDGGIASASKFSTSFWFSSSSSRSMIMHRHHYQRPAEKVIFTIPTSTGASPIRQQHRQPLSLSFFPRRTNFSYAGPRKLSDILKSELLVNKSSAEIVRHNSHFCLLMYTFILQSFGLPLLIYPSWCDVFPFYVCVRALDV